MGILSRFNIRPTGISVFSVMTPLNRHPPLFSMQLEATTRIVEQVCQGNMNLRVQGVRTGVLLVMIRTEKMTRASGVWQAPGEMETGGAPRAQVGGALTVFPAHFCVPSTSGFGFVGQTKVAVCYYTVTLRFSFLAI